MYNDDQTCPVCSQGMHLDTIPGLLSCPTIVTELTNLNTFDSSIRHDDIFSDDIVVQKAATSYFMEVLKVRDQLLNLDNPPAAPPASGPLHGSKLQQVQSSYS